MMRNAVQALEKLDFRFVIGMLLLFLMLLAAEGWLLLLKKPYTEYQQILSARESLSSVLRQSGNQLSELDLLANELKHLSEKLSGELQLPASDDEMAASLMEALDNSASKYGLVLSSVKPKERKQVSVFEEVSFEVSAKGAYLHLSTWMLDFANSLGHNATVTEFDMKSSDEGKQVILSLNIALYRPLRLNEVAK
jgi:Tfp pilus assembly protein PilO